MNMSESPKMDPSSDYLPAAGLKERTWLGGRGPRLTPSQKRRIRDHCLKRDGDRCMICGKLEDLVMGKFEIDHIDSNAGNHYSDNLRLCHHACNSKEWNRNQNNGKRVSSQHQRDRELPPPYALGIESSTVEVRLNVEYENAFRRYCFQKVKETLLTGKSLSSSLSPRRGKRVCWLQSSTSYSYMERLFSPNGPLVQKLDQFDQSYFVDFRDKKDRNLTVVDLEAKYPKKGSRMSIDVSLS